MSEVGKKRVGCIECQFYQSSPQTSFRIRKPGRTVSLLCFSKLKAIHLQGRLPVIIIFFSDFFPDLVHVCNYVFLYVAIPWVEFIYHGLGKGYKMS